MTNNISKITKSMLSNLLRLGSLRGTVKRLKGLYKK